MRRCGECPDLDELVTSDVQDVYLRPHRDVCLRSVLIQYDAVDRGFPWLGTNGYGDQLQGSGIDYDKGISVCDVEASSARRERDRSRRRRTFGGDVGRAEQREQSAEDRLPQSAGGGWVLAKRDNFGAYNSPVGDVNHGDGNRVSLDESVNRVVVSAVRREHSLVPPRKVRAFNQPRRFDFVGNAALVASTTMILSLYPVINMARPSGLRSTPSVMASSPKGDSHARSPVEASIETRLDVWPVPAKTGTNMRSPLTEAREWIPPSIRPKSTLEISEPSNASNT